MPLDPYATATVAAAAFSAALNAAVWYRLGIVLAILKTCKHCPKLG